MNHSTINKAVSLLQKTEIFMQADAGTLTESITAQGEFCFFNRGDVIFSNESYRPVLGLLIEGKATVKKSRAVISTLDAGSLFGAVTLYGERQSYATEITAAANCKVMFMPRLLISGLIAQNTAVAESYIAYLSRRIYFLTDKIEAFTAGSTESRLAGFLLARKQECENETPSVTVENMSLLARELDIGRASLYRALETFEIEGAIKREVKKIVLTDTEKLIMRIS